MPPQTPDDAQAPLDPNAAMQDQDQTVQPVEPTPAAGENTDGSAPQEPVAPEAASVEPTTDQPSGEVPGSDPVPPGEPAPPPADFVSSPNTDTASEQPTDVTAASGVSTDAPTADAGSDTPAEPTQAPDASDDSAGEAQPEKDNDDQLPPAPQGPNPNIVVG